MPQERDWAEIRDTAEPSDPRLVLDPSVRRYGRWHSYICCNPIISAPRPTQQHSFSGGDLAALRWCKRITNWQHSFIFWRRTEHNMHWELFFLEKKKKLKNGIIAKYGSWVPLTRTWKVRVGKQGTAEMMTKRFRSASEPNCTRQKKVWRRSPLQNRLPCLRVFKSLRWWWCTRDKFWCSKTQTQHKVGMW